MTDGQQSPNLKRIDELIELINQVASEAPSPEAFAPIKLTEWQRHELRRLYPESRGRYKLVGGLGDLTARQIELVEREEDSDFPRWRPARGYHPDRMIIDQLTGDSHLYTFGERKERQSGLRYEQLIIERMQAQIDGSRVWTVPDPPRSRGWLGRLLDRMFG